MRFRLNRESGKMTQVLGWIVCIGMVVYLTSYSLLSLHGKFTSRMLTVGRDSSGRITMVPNATFERWEPFPLFDEKVGCMTPKHILFFPLVVLDRKFIHNNP